MGQVNLTLVGQRFLNDGGSVVTLTSGSLSHDPYAGGASFTTVNSAIDGLVAVLQSNWSAVVDQYSD